VEGLAGAGASPPRQTILVREICTDVSNANAANVKTRMNNARNVEPDLRFKAAQLNIEMGDWVHSLAPWQVIAHLTFSWEASIASAMRCYEKFMRTKMRGVSYFYALEQNPGRDGYHVHALWCDCKSKSRQHTWRTWFERYGRNRIEPVNNQDDVADYCAKYVCKEGAWWNVKLLGDRHPQFTMGLPLFGKPPTGK